MTPGRNDLCHCGSGEKYKKCHLRIEEEARRAFLGALPQLQAKQAQAQANERRLREEFGVHINYVAPIMFQGGKVWAIGSRVYPGRRANETFHEFIVSILRGTLGEPWRAAEAARPQGERHFVYECFEQMHAFLSERIDSEEVARVGEVALTPNGWVRYLISLAWDVATLVHAGEPPQELIGRLRDRDNYQGARYELAIAAIFARLDCSIRWLDADPALRRVKHVEFEATHRPSGQTLAVEAKSRHRAGVINQPGTHDPGDPLRADDGALRRLFAKALDKAPDDQPFLIFIDINAPRATDPDWQAGVHDWLGTLTPPTPQDPEAYNAMYVTNFSPHYDADAVGADGSWLVTRPGHVRVQLQHDLQPDLMRALDSYGRVPAFGEDNTLR